MFFTSLGSGDDQRWLLPWFGTSLNQNSYFSTALLQIFWVLHSWSVIPNNHCFLIIILSLGSYTNQEKISMHPVNFQRLFHSSIRVYTHQEQIRQTHVFFYVHIGHFLGFYSYQEHTSKQMTMRQQVLRTSLRSCADPRDIPTQMTILRQLFQISPVLYWSRRNKFPCISPPFSSSFVHLSGPTVAKD